MAFEGFTDEMRDFFVQIALNNNKEFFEAHRKDYITYVRDPMRAFTATLGEAALDVNEQFDVRAEKIVSRIRRDTRFTKDKSPYRDHLWAGFHESGEHTEGSLGLYFEVSAVDVCWGMGIYEASPAQMKALRAAILAHPTQFKKLISGGVMKRFSLLGTDYKRLPAECAGADPALLPWLTKKSFYLEHGEAFEPIGYSAELSGIVSADFRLLVPLYRFLSAAMVKKA